MNISIDLIKQLRDETQVSIADCRMALVKARGDIKKARELLKRRGFDIAAKKASRKTGEGLIDSYIHPNGKIGVLVELLCETDFVAKTADFKNLAHELSMQVAAMNPKNVDALFAQEYIRDSSKTIGDLVKETIAKLGENITVKRFQRFEIGE